MTKSENVSFSDIDPQTLKYLTSNSAKKFLYVEITYVLMSYYNITQNIYISTCVILSHLGNINSLQHLSYMTNYNVQYIPIFISRKHRINNIK